MSNAMSKIVRAIIKHLVFKLALVKNLMVKPFLEKNLTFRLFYEKNLTFFYGHIFTLITMLGALCVAIAPAHAAPDVVIKNTGFGRLFSQPAERSKLDALRQSRVLKTNTTTESLDEETEPTAELPDLPPITLQGYVKRSDGAKSTVWINNQAIQEESQVNQVRIGKLSATGRNKETNLNLQMPANGKQVKLKAGQVYAPQTDEIKELKTVAKEKQLTDTANQNFNDEAEATLP